MKMSKRIIVKKYSKIQVFLSLLVLFVFSGSILVLGSIQQCMFCEGGTSSFSFVRIILSLSVLCGGLIILLNTPLLGGLKERERKILGYISNYSEKGVLTGYQITKRIRSEGLEIHEKQVYRIIEKLEKYGYIEIDLEKRLKVTPWGETFFK